MSTHTWIEKHKGIYAYCAPCAMDGFERQAIGVIGPTPVCGWHAGLPIVINRARNEIRTAAWMTEE